MTRETVVTVPSLISNVIAVHFCGTASIPDEDFRLSSTGATLCAGLLGGPKSDIIGGRLYVSFIATGLDTEDEIPRNNKAVIRIEVDVEQMGAGKATDEVVVVSFIAPV